MVDSKIEYFVDNFIEFAKLFEKYQQIKRIKSQLSKDIITAILPGMYPFDLSQKNATSKKSIAYAIVQI